MLKIAFFKPEETDKFNEFMAHHAPRNSKNQSGIIINQNGTTMVYEDGPMSKSEMVAQLKEEVRLLKTQIFMAEPHLRLKLRETHQFKELLKQAHEASAKETGNDKYKHDSQIKDLEKKVEENESWLLTQRAGQNTAREQIDAYESVMKDLESDNFTI